MIGNLTERIHIANLESASYVLLQNGGDKALNITAFVPQSLNFRVDASHYIFCYLSLILDAYTEEIVGWSVGPTLETKYPLEALKMALKRIEGKNDITLIHHSDRGCQYASSDYIKLLNGNHIQISMTESGDPKDNAQAERINNTMKNELLKGMRFCNIDEVIATVARAVDFYNNERPHMSIDMMTPVMAAFCEGEIKKRWVSLREQAIQNKRALV